MGYSTVRRKHVATASTRRDRPELHDQSGEQGDGVAVQREGEPRDSGDENMQGRE